MLSSLKQLRSLHKELRHDEWLNLKLNKQRWNAAEEMCSLKSYCSSYQPRCLPATKHCLWKNATIWGKQEEIMFIPNILILAICTVQNKYSSGRPQHSRWFIMWECRKALWPFLRKENRGQMCPHLSTEWSSVINLTPVVAVKAIIQL